MAVMRAVGVAHAWCVSCQVVDEVPPVELEPLVAASQLNADEDGMLRTVNIGARRYLPAEFVHADGVLHVCSITPSITRLCERRDRSTAGCRARGPCAARANKYSVPQRAHSQGCSTKARRGDVLCASGVRRVWL